ncbi:hypothetical protein ACIBI4_08565 [Streptomyces sp. NPDC050418]|uniref:hypothetical protein n=1 Tax=Streptomyces sp. NPDC050418 TaxID=3365612 RepID=UPI0037A261C8
MSQAFPPQQPQQPGGPNPYGQPGPFPPAPPVRSGNVGLGIVVGIVAMLVGAAAYGGLMRAFGSEDGSYTEIGYIAVGVGALIGFAAGKLGGNNPVLPIVSALLGAVGVFLGQLFGFSLLISWWSGGLISATEMMTEHFSDLMEGWKEEADAMTYLFLAVGAFAGFGAAKKAGN